MDNRIKNGLIYLGVLVVSSYGFSQSQGGGGKADIVYAGESVVGELAKFNEKADQFFKKYVSKTGYVKYQDILKDKKILDHLVGELSHSYALKSDPQKLSFYINAYNIITIKQVVQFWPIKKVTDKRGFF